MTPPQNLVDLYARVANPRAPMQYHVGAIFAALASVCERRFSVRIDPTDAPLYPNVYVFLVGAPTVGKGVAIDGAEDLLSLTGIAVTRGEITKQAMLVRLMALQKSRGVSPLLVLCPELANAIPPGDAGRVWIQHVTEAYDGGRIDYETRNKGVFRVHSPCLNLLVGTTRSWLRTSVNRTAVEGGFPSRLHVVWFDPLEYEPPPMLADPDHAAVVADLRQRLLLISQLSGTFRITPAGREVLDAWLQNRPHASTEAEASIRGRDRVRIVKLAMLLTLGWLTPHTVYRHQLDEDGNLVVPIGAPDMSRAVALHREFRRGLDKFAEYMLADERAGRVEDVASLIRQYGVVKHTHLQQTARKRWQVYAIELAEILATLEGEGRIKVHRTGPLGGRYYEWKKQRLPKPEAGAGVDEGPDPDVS